MERLSIEDLLLIAEAVLGIPAERLAGATRLGSAASALAAPERYAALADRAAVLCSRLVRSHPLPDGNKRVALLAMLELVARNRGIWQTPVGGQDEIAATIDRLASRRLSEGAFVAWVREHVRTR
jgi:death on curing protein